MLITEEEYYGRVLTDFASLLDEENEETKKEIMSELYRFSHEPCVVEASEKYKRLDENKKYPLAYNYLEWHKKLLPGNAEVMIRLKEKYGNKVLALKDIIETFFDEMANRFPYLSSQAIKLLWQEGKMGLMYSYNWSTTKQVYDFDKDCFEYLINNSVYKTIPIQILNNNLPFDAFAINNDFYAEGLHITQTFVCKYDDIDGPTLGLFMLTEKPDYDYIFISIPLNKEEDIEAKINECLGNVSKQTIDAVKKLIPCLLYLCSANKEIRVLSKRNGYEKNREKGRMKVGIKCDDVGYVLGASVKGYRIKYENSGGHKGSGLGGTKRPHVRSGHFHHYWTGEGRTNLVCKFVPSTFVNGDAEKIVMHKVKK